MGVAFCCVYISIPGIQTLDRHQLSFSSSTLGFSCLGYHVCGQVLITRRICLLYPKRFNRFGSTGSIICFWNMPACHGYCISLVELQSQDFQPRYLLPRLRIPCASRSLYLVDRVFHSTFLRTALNRGRYHQYMQAGPLEYFLFEA
jgi:hypothetical protein